VFTTSDHNYDFDRSILRRIMANHYATEPDHSRMGGWRDRDGRATMKASGTTRNHARQQAQSHVSAGRSRAAEVLCSGPTAIRLAQRVALYFADRHTLSDCRRVWTATSKPESVRGWRAAD
jgi:hypothetical protein